MKPFTIYFPQFYPTEINDKAWGKGFTDWNLVATANAHNRWQRRAPQKGYYDGSSRSLHKQQLDEIIESGLGGIALYHYWFFKHRELGSFEDTLIGEKTNKSTPWFIIWASEPWSKRWIGDSETIASLDPEPSASDIAKHCIHLSKCFNTDTYLKIGGKPVFFWYNLSHFTNPAGIVDSYKSNLSKLGHSIFTGHFIKNPTDKALAKLVDFNYLFEPRLFFGFRKTTNKETGNKIFGLIRSMIGDRNSNRLLVLADRISKKNANCSSSEFYKYLESKERKQLTEGLGSNFQEVISPGWNNYPRYGERFSSLEKPTPKAFRKQVSNAASKNTSLPPLINAWNEWSEGAAIEPCHYLGREYLDELLDLEDQ